MYGVIVEKTEISSPLTCAWHWWYSEGCLLDDNTVFPGVLWFGITILQYALTRFMLAIARARHS